MAHLIGLKVAETKEKNSLGFVGQNLKRKHAVKSWGEYVPKPKSHRNVDDQHTTLIWLFDFLFEPWVYDSFTQQLILGI